MDRGVSFNTQRDLFFSQPRNQHEGCSCPEFVQTLHRCADLLGKRVATVVTKEIEQFRKTFNREQASQAIANGDLALWNYQDLDTTMTETCSENSPVSSPSKHTTEDILHDMLMDATRLLLTTQEPS